MKKLLLVYLPFCTPLSPPYSVTNLYAFLKANLSKDFGLDVLDLNIEFHNRKFKSYKDYFKNIKNKFNADEYLKITKEYNLLTGKIYSDNNGKVVDGLKPEFFDDFVSIIASKSPDVVAFSIVYSSQCFYAFALAKVLREKGIKVVVGGPSVNQKLAKVVDKVLSNEIELLDYINGKVSDYKKLKCSFPLDFSIYKLDDYFVPEAVIPIKTCSTCYYQKCSFCSHYNKGSYFEFSLENVRKTIVASGCKNFFLIDDMISKKRLLEFADVLKGLNVSWVCQLKPLAELDSKTLKTLRDSGLKIILWGIESGSDRLLNLMRKGTNVKDVSKVLFDSHEVGIKNVAYIIFGFPSETKDEFLQTIDFLKQNEKSIDLVSTSVFGLQKGTYVYDNPAEFCISKIINEERTVLDPKVSYEVSRGLTQQQAELLRKKFKRSIENINKYPKTMNFFREHMLCLV